MSIKKNIKWNTRLKSKGEEEYKNTVSLYICMNREYKRKYKCDVILWFVL